MKSQIHAGGRGKGKFKELSPDAKGGVRLATSKEEAISFVQEMLGKTLVTKQTGPRGKQVNRLYIEDGADIERELYLSLLVDRSTSSVSFIASTEGGMDIESVAEQNPEKILTIAIDCDIGVTEANISDLCQALCLDGQAYEDAKKLFPILYKAFVEISRKNIRSNTFVCFVLFLLPNWHIFVAKCKVCYCLW